MNVMSALDARPNSSPSRKETKNVSNANPKNKSRTGIGQKPVLTAEEIKAKIAKKNELPATVALSTAQSRPNSTSSFIDNPEEVLRRSEEAKQALSLKKETEPSKESDQAATIERRNDLGNNDPTNPATVGKLRDVLSKGAFKFSDKERAALGNILG